jgi:hypothetical protein
MTFDAKVVALKTAHKRRAELESELNDLKWIEKGLHNDIVTDPSFEPKSFRECYGNDVTLREEFPPSDPMPWQAVANLGLSEVDQLKLQKAVCFRPTIDPNDGFKIIQNCTSEGAITATSLVQMIIRTQDFQYSPRNEVERVLAYPDLHVVLPGSIHRKLPGAVDRFEPSYKFVRKAK